MHKTLIAGTFIFGLLATSSAHASLILNGSFENTTASACDSNNSNASFNGKMSNATAWGTASEIDIYTSGCFGPNPIDGSRKLHLATGGIGNTTFDAFNFDLVSPLVNGATYDLSFYTASNSVFQNTLGTIDIGLSSLATSFGAPIFSATSTALDTWEFFSTSFVAGAGANFLSVRVSTSSDAWVAVDGFTLDPQSVPEPASLTLIGLALAGLLAHRRRAF